MYKNGFFQKKGPIFRRLGKKPVAGGINFFAKRGGELQCSKDPGPKSSALVVP